VPGLSLYAALVVAAKRQEWTEWTPLWRPFFHSDDHAVLHNARPKPLANQAQDDAICNAVGHHPHQPLMINVVKVSTNVGLVEVPHFLADQCGPQCTQRLVRAAPRPKSVRAVQKVRLEYYFQNACDRTLDQSILDRGDGHRELHTNPVSFWDGPRSGILFTHFVGKASQYLRPGA
jgi:hypothetical protein